MRMNLKLVATPSAELDAVLIDWFRGLEFQHLLHGPLE